ncbi:MAG: hypothetical protein M1833_003833 [Piccolia ochrophora]|nr:MAG: hypothetical protein M1833_003833 [Piccolia ochrophora]
MVPPKRRPPLHADAFDSPHDSASFPTSHHLVITTRKRVYAWDQYGLTSLFESRSNGIVAAKRATHGGDTLAVADSELVVLYNLRQHVDKSYRLKGDEGQLRLLRYGHDSKSLFFTTSLQNSVQCYSLAGSRLLDPSQAHVSPPQCFALSSTSHLLLSASAAPPTIQIQNLTLGTTPTVIRPTVSGAPVQVASFHPERANVFALGFSDGTVAAYDASQTSRDRRECGIREIGYVKGLHKSAVAAEPLNSQLSLQQSQKRAIYKSQANVDDNTTGFDRGITAMEFLPGTKLQTMSVDFLGKCVITDLEPRDKKTGLVLKEFHARAPVTSLSVLPLGRSTPSSHDYPAQTRASIPYRRELLPGQPKGRRRPARSLIALGRADGKVCLFDLDGHLLIEKTIEDDGTRVIDVEWAMGRGYSEGLKLNTGVKDNKRVAEATAMLQCPRTMSDHDVTNDDGEDRPQECARSKRRSLGSVLASGRGSREQVLILDPPLSEVPELEHRPARADNGIDERFFTAKESFSETGWEDVVDNAEHEYLGLFSPIKDNNDGNTITKTTQRQKDVTPPEDRSSSNGKEDDVSARLLTQDRGNLVEQKSPRDSFSTNRGYARVAPAHTASASPNTSYGQRSSASRRADNRGLLLALRKGSRNSFGRPRGGLSLFAPYVPKVPVEGNGTSPALDRQGSRVGPLGHDADAAVEISPRIPARSSSRRPFPPLQRNASTKTRKTVSFTTDTDSDAGGSRPPIPSREGKMLPVRDQVPTRKVSRSAEAPETPESAVLKEASANPRGPGQSRVSSDHTLRTNGEGGFGNSVDHRDACCGCEKVESLQKEIRDVRASFAEDMRALRAEMLGQLQEQKRWYAAALESGKG